MRKISSKVIVVYLLLVLILISSSFSSFYATNTQEQHIILTEVMGDIRFNVSQVALTSEFLAILIKQQETSGSVYETELKALNQQSEQVIEQLAQLSALSYELEDGTIYELSFDQDFEKLFVQAVDTSIESFEKVKANIHAMIVDDLSNTSGNQSLGEEIQVINQQMEKDLYEVIKVCREAADSQKQLSDRIQFVTMLFAVIIFIGLVFTVNKNIYKPVMIIKDTFIRLSKGDLSPRFRRKENDEFRELFEGFNYFLNSLDQIFEIEDNIIKENSLEELLSVITSRLKEFMDFDGFGLIYTNYEKKNFHLSLVGQVLSYNDVVNKPIVYKTICEVGSKLIVPIRLGEINLGYYYFENYQSKVDNSNFIELIKDKLTIAFYKNILVKDLLNIVTEALADATEARDPETANHLMRMSSYSKIIAKSLYEKGRYKDVINAAYIENILITAPMHDIGKIAIEDRILLKPGKLTDEEFAIMKTHAEKGGNILERLDEKFKYYGITYFGMAANIAYGHQEKFDGSGYPKGLKAFDIPLEARICAIADVFDALTSKRPYKEAFSLEKSYRIIKESKGNHFDPELVDSFFENQEEIEKIFYMYKEI